MLPVVVSFLGLLYLSYEMNITNAMYWSIIPLLILTAIFVFHGNIDFWWLEKHPLVLDQPIKDWLLKYDSYYQSLDSESRAKYDNRLTLYMNGRSFSSVGSEMHEVPNDIQGIIASNVVKMMIGLDDHLLGDMDRIFLYKHPFPSPRYQFLHTVETDAEDGVLIFSMEHLIPGVMYPDKFYNIAMHGYAEAYQHVFNKTDFTFLDEISWEQLELIGGLTKEQILQTIGFNDTYISTVAINHYFTHPIRFKQVLPLHYNRLKNHFNN